MPSDDHRPEEEETQLLRRALGDDTARLVGSSLPKQAMVEVYGLTGDLLALVKVPAAGLSIGRAPDQDIRLDDRTVSRRHARIEVAGDRYYIDDAGSLNDTLLNGELVRGKAELRDGAQLTIGLHMLRVTIR